MRDPHLHAVRFCRVVFHTTSHAAADAICREGFDIAKSRWGQRATWFATSPSSSHKHYQARKFCHNMMCPRARDNSTRALSTRRHI
jgi:hypothetical protein